MHQGHKHKSPLKRLKQRATYIIVILVLLAASYLAYDAVWSDGVTSASTSLDAPKEFSVIGQVEFPSEGITVEDVSLNIEVGETAGTISGGQLLIDGLNLESFADTSVNLHGFSGTITKANSGLLHLKGTVTSAILATLVINKNGQSVSVDTTGIQFDKVQVTDISLKTFSFSSIGNIDVANRGSFNVNGERVRIGQFNGNFDIDHAGLGFNGFARSLEIDSIPRVSIK